MTAFTYIVFWRRRPAQTIGDVFEDADEWRRADAEPDEQDDLVLCVVLRSCAVGAINGYLWQIRLTGEQCLHIQQRDQMS